MYNLVTKNSKVEKSKPILDASALPKQPIKRKLEYDDHTTDNKCGKRNHHDNGNGVSTK